MAITSEIIGKLGGGAGVEQIPVDVAVSAYGNEIFYTAEVPEGETWLVALYGNLQSVYSESSQSAQLFIGPYKQPFKIRNGMHGMAHVGTGTIEVGLSRNSTTNSDKFTGTVYTVKL